MPLKVPDGTYMTTITKNGFTIHAVDNHNNLWVWGDDIYAHNKESDRKVLYENWDSRIRGSVPIKIKWFSDNSLKVLDVKSGENMAIVKCEDKDSKIVFFAMTQNEE